VFIKFADAEGLYTFRIEHAYGPSNVVLGYVDIGSFEVRDRLRHHSIEPTITVEIPSPGFHEFRVFANGSYMGRAILEVIAPAR
jgi:hypothetical protein